MLDSVGESVGTTLALPGHSSLVGSRRGVGGVEGFIGPRWAEVSIHPGMASSPIQGFDET